MPGLQPSLGSPDPVEGEEKPCVDCLYETLPGADLDAIKVDKSASETTKGLQTSLDDVTVAIPRLRLPEQAVWNEIDDSATDSLLTSDESSSDGEATHAHGASSLASVFNLCNSAIGAGVLSLPFAFRCAGVVNGLLLIMALACLEGFTLYVLAKFAERYHAHTYGTLIDRALGYKLSTTLSLVLLLAMWGGCIAFLVIIADTFCPLALIVFGPDSGVNRSVVATFVAVFIILPICLPRKLQELTWVSVAALSGFIYTASVIAVFGTQVALKRTPPFSGVRVFKWDWDWLTAVPLIVAGFNCHGNIVAVTWEIHSKPGMLLSYLPKTPREYLTRTTSLGPRPRTHKMVGMLGVIITAMTIIFAGYVIVGFTGYIAYPDTVEGNVLKTLPSDVLSVQIARFVIGCVVMAHYPAVHFPARHSVLDLLGSVLGPQGVPVWVEYLVTVLFVMSTLLVSLLVSDLQVVLGYIGGTVSSFMIFFLPGLLLVNAGMIKGAKAELQNKRASQGSLSPTSLRRTSSWLTSAPQSVLERTASHGIKATKAIVFTPSKSWWTGIALVTLSAVLSLPVVMDIGHTLLHLGGTLYQYLHHI